RPRRHGRCAGAPLEPPPDRPRLRLRYSADVVRARPWTGQARVPPPGRQHLGGAAHQVRPAAAAVVLVALLLGGCGGSHHTPRADLATYVTQVNAVERQLAPPLVSVTRTVAQFSGGRSASPLGVIPSAEAATLHQAGRRI